MASSYKDFQELSRQEVEGSDYEIKFHPGQSPILIMAIHGGKIEPTTTEIANAIAGERHGFYSFEGIKSDGNGILHIPSNRFDEPIAEKAIQRAELILTVHGQIDQADEFLMVGGLDNGLKVAIECELKEAGFKVREPPPDLSGRDPMNICNRGRKRKGIQFEISRKLRDLLKKDAGRLHAFAQAVHRGLESTK